MFIFHSNNTDHHHLAHPDYRDHHLIPLPLDQHYCCHQYYFTPRSYQDLNYRRKRLSKDHQLNYSPKYYYYRQKIYMVTLLDSVVDKLYCYYKQLDTDNIRLD
jgi:hypothetical protein